MKSTKELVLEIEDFNGHVGKTVYGFESVQGEMEKGGKIWKVECCCNSAIRIIHGTISVANTWFKKEKK